MLKTGLNVARFRDHVGMIVEETVAYFERWGESGTKGMCLFVSFYHRKLLAVLVFPLLFFFRFF